MCLLCLLSLVGLDVAGMLRLRCRHGVVRSVLWLEVGLPFGGSLWRVANAMEHGLDGQLGSLEGLLFPDHLSREHIREVGLWGKARGVEGCRRRAQRGLGGQVGLGSLRLLGRLGQLGGLDIASWVLLWLLVLLLVLLLPLLELLQLLLLALLLLLLAGAIRRGGLRRDLGRMDGRLDSRSGGLGRGGLARSRSRDRSRVLGLLRDGLWSAKDRVVNVSRDGTHQLELLVEKGVVVHRERGHVDVPIVNWWRRMSRWWLGAVVRWLLNLGLPVSYPAMFCGGLRV